MTAYENFFPELLAKRITSKHNANALVLVSGRTGSGKSYTTAEICLEMAEEVARIKGGKPEDYFSLDNMAIMNKEEVKRVFEEKLDKKYGIFVLDDISTSYNSRAFNTQGNQIINDILTTFRTLNQALFLTVPMGSQIDKVGRELVHYTVDMQQPMFDKGLSVAKISRVDIQKSGDVFYPFLQDGHQNKFKLHFFKKPNDAFCQAYDEKRDKMYRLMLKDRMEKWMKTDEPKEPKKLKQDENSEIHRDWMSGKYGDMSLKEVAKEKNVSYKSLKSSVSTLKKEMVS